MSDLLADSLAHPTLTGKWMEGMTGSSASAAAADFPALDAALTASGFAFACAVGMWGLDGYDHAAFADACRRYSRLVPVAGFKPLPDMRLMEEMGRLKELGFRGIKLHSRFSRFDVADPLIGEAMEAAGRCGLTVFWCTFHHTTVENWPSMDPLQALVAQLRSAPSARVILLHGGDVEVLRYMQLVRFNSRLLLDLSHTITKYPGSSVDGDMAFLFRQFDRRICLGTDWPQFTHAQLREIYERHSAGLPEDKRLNIAHRNLAQFLGVDM